MDKCKESCLHLHLLNLISGIAVCLYELDQDGIDIDWDDVKVAFKLMKNSLSSIKEDFYDMEENDPDLFILFKTAMKKSDFCKKLFFEKFKEKQ